MQERNQSFDELLRTLVPINGLPRHDQDEIAKQAEILTYKKGRHVFQQGERDDFTFYLLEGVLELYADDQLAQQVEGGTERARYALVHLQPRQLSARANTSVTVLRLKRSLLDRLLTSEQQTGVEEELRASQADGEDVMDWMTRLLQSDLFAHISAANMQQIFTRMESVAVRAGDTILQQGSPGDYYYIVRQGRCEVTRATSAGRDNIRLAELSEGDSFGEEALVSNATRNATVRMLTDGELMRLNKSDFVELIKKPTLRAVPFEEARALLDEGALWLDVRFPDEYKYSRMEPSLNLPLNVLRMRATQLDPDRLYLVYCDTGNRSAAGAFLLAQYGFNVVYLAGGLVQSPAASQLMSGDHAIERKVSQGKDVEAQGRSLSERQENEIHAEQNENGKGATPVSQSQQSAPDASSPSVSEAISPQEGDAQDAALKAECVKLRKQLEEAVKLKQDAETARQAAETAAEQRLREERVKLNAEIKRLSKTLERERRLAREQVELRRKTEDEQAHRLEQEMAQRIREEKARLEVEANERLNEQLEEIVRLTAEADASRNKAEETAMRQLRQERERLESEFAAKREAEEEKYLRLKEDMERRVGEEATKWEQDFTQKMEEASRLMAEAQAMKSEVEATTAARQRVEREASETKDTQAAEALEKARQEKEVAEAARLALEQELKRMVEGHRMMLEKIRQEEEERQRKQREALEQEIRTLQQALDEAQHAKAQAEAAHRAAEARAADLQANNKDVSDISAEAQASFRAELQAIEAEVDQAKERFQAATRIQELAGVAKEAKEQELERQRQDQERLRARLEAEIHEWLSDQDAAEHPSKTKAFQLAEEEWRRIEAQADAAKKAAQEANATLLLEVAAQVGRGEHE